MIVARYYVFDLVDGRGKEYRGIRFHSFDIENYL